MKVVVRESCRVAVDGKRCAGSKKKQKESKISMTSTMKIPLKLYL